MVKISLTSPWRAILFEAVTSHAFHLSTKKGVIVLSKKLFTLSFSEAIYIISLQIRPVTQLFSFLYLSSLLLSYLALYSERATF